MADGSESTHIVLGVIRKNSEARISEFSLPISNLSGFISEGTKVVGLVPGGIDLVSQKPKLTLSPHATISPDTSLVQDFSQPVTYLVTAENGTKATYTVKPFTPQKLTSGLRKGSGRLLWSKTLTQMGLNSTDFMSTSIAISGKYLAVNTRAIKNRYFDRFNGNYEGDMTMETNMFGSLINFSSANDDAGNILIASLANGTGSKLTVYKWKGVKDSAPVKFIEWTNDMTTTAAGAGRKISVKGDLNGNALIFMGASQYSNTILRWQVTGGVLKSQSPDKIVYTGTKLWSYLADIVSTGTSITDNLFISGYPSDLVCTNAAANAVIGQVDLAASGYGTNHSIDLVKFNNVPYLTAINISSDQLSGFSYLYDVTDPSKLSTVPSSSEYANVCVYKTEAIASPVKNANTTGDVLLKVSDDGYKMILYTLITNGGVSAYEFDCVNVDAL